MHARCQFKIIRLSWLAACFIVTFSLFAQTIIVCPECAYEATPDARFCAHCGASIEKVETTTNATPTQPSAILTIPGGERSPLEDISAISAADPAALVKEDIVLGARFMTEGSTQNPAAALAALINARAIIAITEPGIIDPDTRSTALKGIVSMREAVSRVRTSCPRCHGKGQEDAVQNFSSLNGVRSPLVIGKRTCPMCAGRGSILRLRKISEIKSLLGSGKQLFGDEALVRERIKLGNAWLSPALAEHLTLRQQATLRHYAADPCPECTGYGKTDCTICDNTGFAHCTAQGCVNGTIRPPPAARSNPRETRIESMQLTTPRICPACKGTALVTCTQCAGTGSINCRRCSGSGERNICARCKGEGFQPCNICKGTGKDRKGQDCTSCSQEGIVICTSCGGDGYGR